MKFWVAFLFVLIQLNNFAQDFELKSYSIADGLPQSQVYDITEDHNGKLWLATRGGGLASFDGANFDVFTTQEGLVNNFVSTVFHDSKDNLWVGTSNGLSLYNGIRFRNFKLEGESFKVSISSIAESKKQELYFGTSNGIYKRENKKNVNISKDIGLPGNSITDLYFDNFQNLWVAHNKGLTRFKNGTSKHYTSHEVGNSFPQCFAEGKFNEIWVGTYGKGVFKVKGDKLTFIPETNGLIVLDIYFNEEEMWLSTFKNGVLIYDLKTQTIRPIDDSQHLPTKNCRTVFKDSWGGIWIGTSGGGLLKYGRSSIKSYNGNKGLEGKYIYTVAASQDSGVWVSTNARKLYKLNKNEFVEYGVNQNIYPQKIKAILDDSKGRLWIGTEGSGLTVWKEGKSKTYKSRKHLESKFIKDIVEDKEGNIWVATSSGVSKFSPDLSNVQFFNVNNQNLHYNRVTALMCDRSNRIWYATRGRGIGCISDTGLIKMTTKEGLSDNTIRDIVEDDLGNMYLATANGGVDVLNIYAETIVVRNLNTSNGLNFENVYSVACDAKNQLWVGGAKGVDRISNPFKKDMEVKSFGLSEGFIGLETTQGAVTVDKQKNIWWGTINGLMKKPVGAILNSAKAPKISLASVNLFYENIQGTQYEPNIFNWYTAGNLNLEFKDNHVGFVLDGNDLSRPNGLKYKWRLDGGDGRWSPVITQNEIFFSNLSPGKYIFQAIAINKDGIESEQLDFYFTISAPFFYKLWFWILVIIVLIAIAVLIIKKRINGIKLRANEEAEKLRLEKEVLEMEQKALRLQMNPHFIFNALNAIQDQIREEDNKGARHSLSKFSKLMRQILESSMDDYISLDQEIGMLENYLSIEKLTRNNTFKYSVVISPDIDSEEEGIPPMLIQPFLENAIIHGIASLELVGEINLSFDLEGEFLKVCIEDNGVGREKAKQLKAQQAQQHKSIALDVIQNRLKNLSSGEFESSYKVDDIVEEGEITGTLVTVFIKREVIWG